jgi:trk system potassium uptake protein TrkH
MFFKAICPGLGRYLLSLSCVLAIPLIVAVLYRFFWGDPNQPDSMWGFLFTGALALSLGLILSRLYKQSEKTATRSESILLVVVIWFVTAAFGALPFLFSGTFSNPLDAYFESMSALTTSGATVIPITELETLGKAILFWRSFLQWIGGMGIVVLFVAVLPALSMGGRFLFEAEVSGPTKDSMTPRIKETASLLWKIYVGLTALQTILLIATNSEMPLFDAINISFATVSTGGFTITSEGIAGYHSLATNVIVTIFMLLGSINFGLYIYCLRGKLFKLYDTELIVYLCALACASLIVSWNLWISSALPFSFQEALAFGTFQAISSQTSTGFALTNYDQWPFICQALLLILMFVGGMAGSTSGGIKIARHVVLLRVLKHKVESIFRPDAVRVLKVGEKEITDRSAITVLVYFCILISFAVLGTLLLLMDGIDPQTAMTTIATMTNNGGLSFGLAGVTGSYAFLPPFSKIVSIIWMVLGRLEFFALLVLCLPSFWRKR